MGDWLKQTADHPLFDSLLWSRPETKTRAGKLLIVGGNQHEFSLPAEAYNLSLKAGVGQAKVMLPASLKKSLGALVEDTVFAPSTSVGSFSREALAELKDSSAWADLTLLAGNLGHSSETAIMLESFITSDSSPLVVNSDCLDIFMTNAEALFKRQQCLIVSEANEFQKLLNRIHYPKALTLSMNLFNLNDLLQELTIKYPLAISLYWQKQLVVAHAGKVSSTPENLRVNKWALIMSVYSSVWWLQNLDQIFEASTCAAYSLLTYK